MQRKISITGELGSGKSTIAKILSEELGMQYLSTGAIQRSIAMRYGMNTLELNKYADNHKEIDDEIDNTLRELNQSQKEFVIDSRLAWFFIPNSFKIYFLIDIEVAAKRVINDSTRISESYISKESAISNIIERKESENKRFLLEYNADCLNLENFNLVINTTELRTIDISKFIIDVILGEVKNTNKIIWCNPKILYPTQHIRESIGLNESIELRKLINTPNFLIENPIKVIEKSGSWALLDGHKRTSAAILEGIKLVPVELVAKNEQMLQFKITATKYFGDTVKGSWLYDWEDAHKFRFYKYPFENND